MSFWRKLKFLRTAEAEMQEELRSLREMAGAVLSLGLGIGANAAIFSLIDRVLWRQLPVREPERLLSFEDSVSYFALQQFGAKSAEVLEGVTGATGSMERDISTGGEARPGGVELVAGNYFDLLGVMAAGAPRRALGSDGRPAPRLGVATFRDPPTSTRLTKPPPESASTFP